MASGVFTLTVDPEDVLTSAMEGYGQGSGQLIQEVYREFAADEIKKDIITQGIFPVSGRRFKGHSKGAKAAGTKIFNRTEISGFDLKVIAGGSRGYLVFPDEGRGVHNPRAQRFMAAGLQQAVQPITERIIAKLSEN